jgi:hypothetical protein
LKVYFYEWEKFKFLSGVFKQPNVAVMWVILQLHPQDFPDSNLSTSSDYPDEVSLVMSVPSDKLWDGTSN